MVVILEFLMTTNAYSDNVDRKRVTLESTSKEPKGTQDLLAMTAKDSTPGALVTGMNTLTTDSTNNGESFFEPLKLGLDSGDDSSFSSCDDDDYFFGFPEIDEGEASDPPFHYFHKKRHMANDNIDAQKAIPPSAVASSASNEEDIHSNKSTVSLPSLLASSTLSPSSAPDLDTSLSNSATSKKRAKVKHKPKRKSRVSLHKSVSVIPIPSRFEYSSIVKERIWSSSAELCANAARNSVEFAAEGWDWRNVIEDEDMLLHQSSGELIHPIHVRNALVPQPGVDENLTLQLLSGLVPNKTQSQLKSAEVGIDVPSQIQAPIKTDPITVAEK